MIKRVSEINKKEKENQDSQCTCNSNSQHYKFLENIELNAYHILPIPQYESEKRETELKDLKKLYIESDLISKTRRIFSHEEKDIKDIDLVLSKIQEVYELNKETLANDLFGVCGDINTLIKFYDGQTGLKWYNDEDEILRQTNDPQSIDYQLLLSYKGADEIEKRSKFLNIKNELLS